MHVSSDTAYFGQDSLQAHPSLSEEANRRAKN